MSSDMCMDYELAPAAAPVVAPAAVPAAVPVAAASTSTQTIKDLLAANAEGKLGVVSALARLTVNSSKPLSAESLFLKNMQLSKLHSDLAEAAQNCGMNIYSLNGSPHPTFLLELDKRTSDIFVERGFFADLYARMIDKWRKNPREKIILSGNAGIGKSWFQVYLLRRILLERQDALFDFIVRHVGKEFYLIDLNTGSGYELEGGERHIKTLLSDHGRILYLYEPEGEINQPPLKVTAPSLSTLSPRPTRIQEYVKSHPTMLYMPVWNFNELELVAALEIETPEAWAVYHDNLHVFGGIARYALQFDPVKKRSDKDKVDTRCGAVTADMLRSLAADIDDDPKSENRNNLSGFVVSYDVPRDGNNRFSEKGLTMTSNYVRETVLERMSLVSASDHLHAFTGHLDAKSRDITEKISKFPLFTCWQPGKRRCNGSTMPLEGLPRRTQTNFPSTNEASIDRRITTRRRLTILPTRRFLSRTVSP